MAGKHCISSKKLVVNSITIITLICVLSSVWGSPASYKPPGFHDGSSIGYEDLEDKCNTDESVQILCQTCAKVTKSEIVYPMCCTNKEDARVWCDRYTSFGIQ